MRPAVVNLIKTFALSILQRKTEQQIDCLNNFLKFNFIKINCAHIILVCNVHIIIEMNLSD